MLRCPWCGEWEHVETYMQLSIPPKYPKQCVAIYKHRGCRMVFALSS